jgi:primosomal protein N' (replication factor Y)
MSQSTLFPTPLESTEAAAPHAGPFAAVALEQSVDKMLDYAIPPRLVASLAVGQRVRVPLGRGNRPAHGYVVDIHAVSDYPKIKLLTSIEDDRVLITPNLLELARWMSRYYVSPLGTVLDSILPSAVRKRVGLGYTQMVRLVQDREQVQALLEKTRAPKRRAILARLLLIAPGESIELTRLAGEAGATPVTVRKLVRAGLITITPQADFGGLTDGMGSAAGGEGELTLNAAQQTAVDALVPRIRGGGFSVNLLMGVTGSGKTEVYLRCIREAVDRGKQAIVLVPEIALTPQTVRRFIARFPNVAILHSGLTASNRHRFWQQVLTGHAQVVVGARSAVFAPTPNLGIIVVDEEHESSYKQDTAPRYHARDVAIKRAQLEEIPVLLGSATPSLEMYWRVKKGEEGTEARRHEGTKGEEVDTEGAFCAPAGDAAPLPASVPFVPSCLRASVPSTYHLLTLPARVRGLDLAHVELVDMKVESRFRKGVHLLSQRLEHLLRVTVESGRQAILLLNRRGYSNFVYCSSCTNAIQCKFCDTTMTYHRSAGTLAKGATLAEGLHTGQLHCHYCLAVNPLPDKCPHCGKKLSLFGLGTQRVEEELARKFPDLKFARVDSDTMRNSRDYEAMLDRFSRGEISVMLGTQMIAKGLDYPNVTLVGVISGDTALALPDFRASERTFQLITQVSGRAGRGDAKGRVVLQTFLPDDPAIQAAIRQDFIGFAKKELEHRRETELPPFSRMVRIVLRDQEPEKLHVHGDELASQLSAAIAVVSPGVRMRGPMPCAINRIAGYWRNQIILQCPTAGPLQKVLAMVRDKGHLARGDRVAVDVDPVSLL